MSENKADVKKVLESRGERTLFDVRTPAEFAKGHIPGALNLPLFTNEERAIVGTIYKQESPELAMLKGLEFAGQKMRWYVEEVQRLAAGKSIAVHCWRGGKRSESMGWLLGQAGFEVLTLKGGYKAYRRYAQDFLTEQTAPLIVLGGYTGSGKTEVLHALAEAGEQVLDLEALAHHKGSAFGALGEIEQPSVEQFENDLFEAYAKLDHTRRIWLEDESRTIGRVYLPDGFWERMNQAPIIQLNIPLEARIQHLVKVYAGFPKEKLIESFQRIRKKLGGQHLNAAIQSLESEDYAEAAQIALVYYDKTYEHSLQRKGDVRVCQFQAEALEPGRIAAELIAFANELDGALICKDATDS